MGTSNVGGDWGTVDGPGDQGGQSSSGDYVGSAGPAGVEQPVLHVGHINRPDIGYINRPAGSEQIDQPAESVGPALPAKDVVVRLTLSIPQDRHEELVSSLPSFARLVEAEILHGGGWDPLGSQ